MELVAVLAGLPRLPSRLSLRAQDSLCACRGRAPSPVPAWGGEPERVVPLAPGRGRLDALRALQTLAASEGAPRALVAVCLGGAPTAREAAPSPVTVLSGACCAPWPSWGGACPASRVCRQAVQVSGAGARAAGASESSRGGTDGVFAFLFQSGSRYGGCVTSPDAARGGPGVLVAPGPAQHPGRGPGAPSGSTSAWLPALSARPGSLA